MATLACEPDVNRAPFILSFGFYLAWMLGIAVVSRQRVKDIARVHTDVDDYAAHYSGGKSYGTVVTFLTMFSTIFSGYTVLGVPQEGNDLGWSFALRWSYIVLPAMLTLLVFAPRIRRIAIMRNYDSLGDFLVDRYNNKMVTLLTSGIWCAFMMGMCLSQMFQMYLFIPVIGGLDTTGQSMLDPKITLAFIAAIIAFCEMMGGFDSVAVSDAFQSAVMLFALAAVPIASHVVFGGAGNSVATGCQNTELIDCGAGKNNTFNIEATCMPGCIMAMSKGGSSFSNGCLEDVNPFYAVHPAITWSNWYHNSTVTPPAPYVPFLPIDGFLYDAIEYSNFAWMHYICMGLSIFFAYAYNVPQCMRIFSAKTDTAVKRGGVFLMLGCYIATVPSILLGIQIHSNLKEVYQKPPNTLGASAYGILMTDFLRRGGFYSFLSVIGSVSALAASMSTIDSNLIGIGNCLTNDILNKIVAPAFPKLGTPFAVSIINKIVTASVMISVTCALLWSCTFNQDADYCPATPQMTVTEVNVKIIGWVWMLGGIGFIPMCLVLWAKEPSPIAVIVYIITIVGAFAGIGAYVDTVSHYHSNAAYVNKADGFGSAPIKTVYFSSFKAPIVVLPVMYFLCAVASKLIKTRGNFFNYDKSVFLKFSGGKSEEMLDKATILEFMKGTVEPCTTKIGFIGTLFAVLVTLLSLPFYGEPLGGCNMISWGANKGAKTWGLMGCNGPSYMGGIPSFVFISFAGMFACTLIMLAVFSRWKCCDSEASIFQGVNIAADDISNNKVGVEAVEMDEKPAAEESA